MTQEVLLSAIISILHKEEDRAREKGLTDCLYILRALAGRIEGLATVHSLLSASGWRPLFLSELCEQVIRMALYGLPLSKTVRLDIHNSPLRVNSNQAHQLALVINEIATNSIKHALQERDEARIEVGFDSDAQNIHVRFRDDGPGYPAEILAGDLSSTCVGLDLVHGIVSKTLRGSVNLGNDKGAVSCISFRRDESPNPEDIKTQRSLIPICGFCKRIREDEDFWQEVEVYLEKHFETKFSHSLCPDCVKEHYSDIAKHLFKE
jgi:two-component sensor histidine kinase